MSQTTPTTVSGAEAPYQQGRRFCGHCGREFYGALRARWCSDACRQAAYRARQKKQRVTA